METIRLLDALSKQLETKGIEEEEEEEIPMEQIRDSPLINDKLIQFYQNQIQSLQKQLEDSKKETYKAQSTLKKLQNKYEEKEHGYVSQIESLQLQHEFDMNQAEKDLIALEEQYSQEISTLKNAHAFQLRQMEHNFKEEIAFLQNEFEIQKQEIEEQVKLFEDNCEEKFKELIEERDGAFSAYENLMKNVKILRLRKKKMEKEYETKFLEFALEMKKKELELQSMLKQERKLLDKEARKRVDKAFDELHL